MGDCGSGDVTLLSLLFFAEPDLGRLRCPTPLDRIGAIAISGDFVLAVGPMTGRRRGVVLGRYQRPAGAFGSLDLPGNWLGTPASITMSGNTGVVGGWLTEVGPMGLSPSVLATFNLQPVEHPARPRPRYGRAASTCRVSRGVLRGFGTARHRRDQCRPEQRERRQRACIASAVEPVNQVGGGGAR